MTSSPPLLMNSSHLRPLQRILPHAVVGLSLVGIYLATLAPGLTWANNGSDGGDLITAAATRGIAHPTGYPLYLLVARLLQWLPIGSLAFRTNLMSAVFTSLAAVLIMILVMSSTQSPVAHFQWPSALAAGYAFGLAPLIWSQAVITEVYALQSFLTGLIIYLYSHPTQDSLSRQKYMDYGRGLVLGLAMGNHVTTILLIPVALLLGCFHDSPKPNAAPRNHRPWFGNLKFELASMFRQLTGFGAGLCIYLILPLRALTHPPINWGNVVTPDRFWWLVSGQLYQSYYLQFNLSEIWGRVQAGAALLIQQFGYPGIVLGLMGLIVFGSRSRLYILTTWMAVTSMMFSVLYGSADSDVYLIPTFLSFAIWLGLGLAALTPQFIQQSSLMRVYLALLVLGYFAARSITLMSQVDASQDRRAETFGREILSTAPENAILFAKGDRAVFTLWYFHFALGERPDLAVLAEDLLHFDWYQENLRATYSSLAIPGPFPWPETIARANALRAVCYVQFAGRTELYCQQPVISP